MTFDWGTGFTGVSCVTGSSCLVAGYAPTHTAGVSTTLMYRWNGKTWKALKPVTPTGVTGLILNSVSCTSPKSCVAVGNGSGPVGDVAEVWNGKVWTATGPIAWPAGTVKPGVASVSCTTPSFCVTAGATNWNSLVGGLQTGRELASVWNGKRWTATPVAAPGKGKAGQLSGVKCLKRTFCVAVGETDLYDSDRGTGTGLSGFWNGTSWHLVGAK
jgi:hypothetical protein